MESAALDLHLSALIVNGSGNGTAGLRACSELSNCTRLHSLEPYFYIPLSSVNALLSAWSLGFFARNASSVHPVLRRLLIALTAFEVLFHCSVLGFYARTLHHSESGAQQTRLDPASGPGSAVQLCLLRFSLTMRNWTMNFISWSRLEAVFRPLAVRSHSLFRLSNVVAMETAAGLLGLGLSVAMVTAHDANRLTGWQLHAVEVTFYSYQGMLPIVSIFAATSVTVCVLRRAGFKRRAAVATPGAVRQCRRERQAIRIIVALSVSCLILEGPTDVCGFIRSKSPLTELIVNTLVELDSLFNFFVLACTTGMCRRRLDRYGDDADHSLPRGDQRPRRRQQFTLLKQPTSGNLGRLTAHRRDSFCSLSNCQSCQRHQQQQQQSQSREPTEMPLLNCSPSQIAAAIETAMETVV